ncbi:hypothetical protein A6F68_00723 [Tsuneonella dongtanensis]|uniref:Lipoprotein n=1 Tax=Tsuneonella dongtanensis TaxID=692370 RepID=A0A1B2AAU2_9SPHN|nr:hypothetical protein [Tsuneonella dongtanensis]ANY19252.1 hypothetical protein A6F68_00723 [Tsuneonella dongtanensis]
MKTRLMLAAATSFALAACGGAKTEPAPADTTAATAPMAEATFPAVPTNARTSVKYEGSYSQTGADGKTSTLALGPNDSWTLTAADGTVTKGTYNWYSDNSRILIGDDVYAIADGAVYKLADKNAPVTGPFTEDVTWRRTTM